jgi:hypothetical protein
VFEMYQHSPRIFAPSNEYLAPYKAIMDGDREMLRAHKMPKGSTRLAVSMQKHAARYHVRLPERREEEFAEWVYSNPNRCVGLRLNQEIFWALAANYGDKLEIGDFVDFALTSAVPYVDAATLDRRMRNYCDIASRNIVQLGAAHNYRQRVYDDAADIMHRFP